MVLEIKIEIMKYWFYVLVIIGLHAGPSLKNHMKNCILLSAYRLDYVSKQYISITTLYPIKYILPIYIYQSIHIFSNYIEAAELGLGSFHTNMTTMLYFWPNQALVRVKDSRSRYLCVCVCVSVGVCVWRCIILSETKVYMMRQKIISLKNH